MSTSEIPTEVLHQLYRGYCLAKFPYTPGVWVSEEARQSRIDYDASSYYKVYEDGSSGHVGPLAELVKAAFAAGRESATKCGNEGDFGNVGSLRRYRCTGEEHRAALVGPCTYRDVEDETYLGARFPA